MALQIRFLSLWLNLRLISTLIWNNDAENESFVCSVYKSTSLKTNNIFHKPKWVAQFPKF